MATSTTNYSFTLPEVGGDTDQWGTQLNANWTSLDSTLKTVADSVGDDVTLTGNDFLTISGQAITVGSVDLTTDVTGTLPVGSGGTGLAALGSANQVLGVNSGGTALEYKTLSTGGTVTSVAVTGSDGIEIDSGSPVTTSGTIALRINATSLSTHLGLGDLATQSTITESQISDLQSYLTAESNDLSSVVTWANVPDINITESSVTQHQAALSITESQISDFGSYQTSDAGLTSIAGLTTAADKMIYTTASDVYAVADLTAAGRAILDDADSSAQRTTLGLGALATQDTITESQISDLQSYLTAEVNDLSAAVTWANVPDANITQSSVTQHQAALSITESQISDLQTYLTAETNDLSTAVTGTLGTGNGGTGLTAIGTANQVLAVNAAATALEFQTLATGGTVTSVSVSGLDGIEVDSGSPITSSGTIALGINATSLSTHLGLGSMATQNANAVAITGGTINTVQPATGQSLTIKDEDGNTAITIGTDNTAAGYLSLNFGSYHGDSGGSGSGTLSGNTLDDYEIGSWTATLASGATTTPTQTGRYIKVGNVVHISLNGFFGTITVNGTAIEISGLPFTTSSDSNFNPTGTIGQLARAQYQASSHHFCNADTSSTTVLFSYTSANTGSSSALLSQSTGSYTPNFAFQMTYLID